MAVVDTVRGPVDSASLGTTLTHEHVVISNPEFARDHPELAWPRGRDSAVAEVTALLRRVKQRGVDTIVDCTAILHGRDTDFVREVNAAVDINIVLSTGIYTYDHLPFHLALRAPEPGGRDILTDMFVRDITVGVADSGVRAQNIKVATDRQGVTPNNERILRAAARAAVETGVPVTTHTHAADRNGLDQQRIFAEEGLDLSHVVIGHSGDSTDLDYLRALLDAGSFIASDRFGLNGTGRADEAQRIATIVALCNEGWASRITLSHDSLMACDWMDSFEDYPDTWVATHISDVVIPALREAGVSEADLHAMLVEAPAAMFSSLATVPA